MRQVPLTKDELLAYMEKHDARLKRVYKISLATYVKTYDAQGGKCAICKFPKGWPQNGRLPFVVDHDHRTGKVRGLLCHRCNVGLGMFRDHTDRFHNAKLYIAGKATKNITRTPRKKKKRRSKLERMQRREEQARMDSFDRAIGE
jgi:hypothetical protein